MHVCDSVVCRAKLLAKEDQFKAEKEEALRDALTGASGVTLFARDHRQLADINYMKQVVRAREWQSVRAWQ